MQKSISRATRAGQSLSLQNNFKSKKGQTVWFEFSGGESEKRRWQCEFRLFPRQNGKSKFSLNRTFQARWPAVSCCFCLGLIWDCGSTTRGWQRDIRSAFMGLYFSLSVDCDCLFGADERHLIKKFCVSGPGNSFESNSDELLACNCGRRRNDSADHRKYVMSF